MKFNTIETTALCSIMGILLALALTFSAGEAKPTEDPTPEPAELLTCAETTEKPTPIFINMAEAELIGRTIWGEAEGVDSETERAAVAWCILNRVDAWDQTIEEVVTAPYQFDGFIPEGECPIEHIELAIDVLARWTREKLGDTDVGRVLPEGYLYFIGDGVHNYFTEEWQATNYWAWTSPSPYND